MASRKNIFTRYWPIMLLAVGLAERAHAPLMSGALASTKAHDAANPTGAAVHAPPGTAKKTKSDVGIPPNTAPGDPSRIEKKLKELPPPADLQEPWDINPASVQPATDVTPISLLHTNQPDKGAMLDDLDLPFFSTASVGSPIDPIPPTTSVEVYGGYLPINFASTGTADNVGPVHHGITVTGVQAVPEPGMLPVVVGALALLGRSRGKRNANPEPLKG